MKKDDLFIPSNSDIKCENIEIGEIKLEPMDATYDYCIPTDQYLPKVPGEIKREYIHPVKTEIVMDTLDETNATEQQFEIKNEEIDVGEIKLEHIDPADSLGNCFVPTSQCLTKESHIKKTCIEETKYQCIPPLYFYNVKRK